MPPPCVDVREIAHNSPSYHDGMAHREQILRRPLGLQLTPHDTQGKEDERHFALFNADTMVGGVIARTESETTVRLRQMWIHPDHSNQGLGRKLLKQVLDILAGNGISEVTLHAREPVTGFYRECGFKTSGDPFTEVGIPHLRMTRAVSPETRSPDGHR